MTNSRVSQIRDWKHPLVILILSLLVLSSFWAPKVYAASTQVIYYFNGYDPSYAWPSDTEHDPSYMVDGNEWTHSGDGWENPADITQLCNSNTCPGTDFGAITKVEMQAKIDVYGSEGFLYIIPKFVGGNGTTRLYQNVYAPQGGLTGWIDITTDPNAPSTWSWTHVKDLDVWIRGKHTVGYHDESVYKIWIRVTFAVEYVDTYDSSYSTLKGEYVFPGDTVYAKAMGLTQGEAWLPGWHKRMKMTINQSDVSSSLTDFPLLIHLSTSSGQGAEDVSFVFDELTSDSNRKRIAVTTGDGMVECPVEIEKWDDANEQAWLWVKVPSVSSTSGTVLYLYYDSTHADNADYVGDPGSVPARRIWDKYSYTVWTYEYGGVWHLDEAVSDGTPGGQKDSTHYGNNGTPRNFQDGGGGATGTTGKIDGADNFAGDDDYVTVTSPTNLAPTNYLTVSAWIKISGSISHSGEIVTGGDSYGLRVWPDERVLFYKYVGGGQWVNMAPTGVDVIDNAYHYIVGVQSNTGMFLYLDGAQIDSNGNTTAIAYGLGSTLEIGRHGNGNPDYNFTGIIDEVRVETVARDSAWVKACYESGRDHLVDYGSEEVKGGSVASWLSGWKKRLKMTIDHTDISSGLTNFPVLLYLSSSSGIYKDSVVSVFNELGGDANRKKIAVTTSDGTTQCYVEIEKWNSTNTKAWLWAKVPSVSSTADTVLYLYYDASHADNTAYVGDSGSRTEVWDSNFAGVWHLGESSSTRYDSTTNDNDLAPSGTVSSSNSGRIGSAASFAISPEGSLSIADNAALSITGKMTISAWIRLTTLPSAGYDQMAIVSKWDANVQNSYYLLVSDDTPTDKTMAYLYYNGIAGSDAEGGTTLSTSTWYYVNLVYDHSIDFRLYLNGSVDVSTDNPETYNNGIYDGTAAFHIGRRGDLSDEMNGLIDEVRVSKIDRTAAWVKASYESERDHLVDYGSEETRYDIKYYSDWLGTPVLEGSQSNVSEGVRGEWRSSYALQAGDPTGTWGVTVYDAGTSTLRASCSFTVVPKVPEFPYGAILPLAASFSIYWTIRKIRKKVEDLAPRGA